MKNTAPLYSAGNSGQLALPPGLISFTSVVPARPLKLDVRNSTFEPEPSSALK